MKAFVTWVLLADTSFARILESPDIGEKLYQPNNSTFSAPAKNDWSDDEGRVQATMGQSKSRMVKRVEYEPETEQFARELISTLDLAHRKNRFDRLVISAAPGMLGLLRSLMPDHLKSVLKAELNKDLARIPTEEVEKHFAGVVRF